jgi:hypothetical protein
MVSSGNKVVEQLHSHYKVKGLDLAFATNTGREKMVKNPYRGKIFEDFFGFFKQERMK